MRDILIGGAWPYANGSLHIGRLEIMYILYQEVIVMEPLWQFGQNRRTGHHRRLVTFITKNLWNVLKGWALVMIYTRKHLQRSTKIL